MALKILWLVDHLGYDGILHGAGMYYLRTIPALSASEFQAELCVLRPRDMLSAAFEQAGIVLHHLGKAKYDPLTLVEVVKLARRLKVTLFHCHGYGASNFGRLAGWLLGVPVVLHAHDEDMNYPWLQGVVDALLRRRSTLTIAVSNAVARSCLRKRHLPEGTIRVLANGIDLKQLKPSFRATDHETGGAVIGVVARLRAEKGVDVMISAMTEIMRRSPGCTLLVAGDGPLRGELEAMARSLGIHEQVKFLGFVQDVTAVMQKADVVVVPSRTEGFPLALVEAMAMEKAIVACSVGGVTEIISPGITGELVPPERPSAIADAVCELLERPAKAESLAKHARRESLRYGMDYHVGHLRAWYRELLCRKPTRSECQR